MKKVFLLSVIMFLFIIQRYSFSQNEKQIFETDAMSELEINGLGANYNFGYSVSGAGDVNGDGFDDIIAGAFGYNSNQGRAYIYFGGNIMNAAPDVVLTGEAAANLFGTSVSGAGDVNGDGYADVIVGASGYSSSTGRAYIYYGGIAMNNVADVTLTGQATSNNFGISVSRADDVNGDGYGDVIIGATGYSTSTGRSYIYFGGSVMDNTADVTLTGEAVNNQFGRSVSKTGDVNGDGYNDVIVGANGYSTSTGRAYIFFGGAVMNAVADVTFTGEAINNQFGFSVSNADDINGDGFNDVIVGAYTYNTTVGRAYIYFGGSSMNNIADVTLTGAAANSQLGVSVAGLGDYNSDGFSDVIVGANLVNSNTGKAYLYLGKTNMDNISDNTFNGDAGGGQFGRSVSCAGDVNKDGYKDIVIGAYALNTNTGKCYVYQNKLIGSDIFDLRVYGETAGSYLGACVADAGDVNGDGYSDMIASSSSFNSNTGRVYIYFGGTNIDTIADVLLNGEDFGNYFGASAASAGDVNGDGYSDIIVGSVNANLTYGRAYVYFGGTTMDNTADVIMNGETANSGFGHLVAGAGDINGDGFDDVSVSEPYYDDTDRGRVLIYHGGSAMNNVFDFIYFGQNSGDRFGLSMSGAGDFNGDGYSDIMVGSDEINVQTGKVYVFYGSPFSSTTPDLIISGENAYDEFASSISCAGDVNGDGYSDIIIGAANYFAGSSTGRAYIYYGSTDPDSSIDVILPGGSAFSIFGNSVSKAGDVNGDGYDDVAVASRGYNTNTGKIQVYFGGTNMDNTSDINMTNGIDEQLGSWVSGGGDMNGDGLSDLIVGAFSNDARINNAGAVYVYLSSAPSAVPSLMNVKDVPADQGGKVQLKWVRSSYDVVGINRITDYLIERSNPPVSGSFSWESIAFVPAVKNPFYLYTAATLTDSTATNTGIYFYRVTARTSDPSEFWRTGNMSGHSVDNIAPLAVQNLTSVLSGNKIDLSWAGNSEPDLFNYLVYRSTSPTIDPDVEDPYAVTTNTFYSDASPVAGTNYFVVAQDIHNNKSPVSVVSGQSFILNLTAFIEGFYDASTNNMVSDTVRVYLRNSTAPYAIVDSSKSKLDASGNGSFNFNNASIGNPYYIVLKHRNSIETWSSSGNSFVSNSLTFNFSTASNKAFGNNMKSVDTSPVRFAVYSGDVTGEGSVNLTDKIKVYNDGVNFVSGYVVSDVNGDNTVNLTDLLTTHNNSSAFVSVVKP